MAKCRSILLYWEPGLSDRDEIIILWALHEDSQSMSIPYEILKTLSNSPNAS